MKIDDLFEEKKRLETEFRSRSEATPCQREEFLRYCCERILPLVRQELIVNDEIASKRRMLTLLMKDMLEETNDHIRSGNVALALTLLTPANMLAGQIYAEDAFGTEVAAQLEIYQEDRCSDSKGRDFITELRNIIC